MKNHIYSIENYVNKIVKEQLEFFLYEIAIKERINYKKLHKKYIK